VKKIAKTSPASSDVAKLADLDSCTPTVKAKKGRIDILFVNAGIGELAPLGAITEEHFDKTFNTNVKGLLFTVQKALLCCRTLPRIHPERFDRRIHRQSGVQRYSATKAAVRSSRGFSVPSIEDQYARTTAPRPWSRCKR